MSQPKGVIEDEQIKPRQTTGNESSKPARPATTRLRHLARPLIIPRSRVDPCDITVHAAYNPDPPLNLSILLAPDWMRLPIPAAEINRGVRRSRKLIPRNVHVHGAAQVHDGARVQAGNEARAGSSRGREHDGRAAVGDEVRACFVADVAREPPGAGGDEGCVGHLLVAAGGVVGGRHDGGEGAVGWERLDRQLVVGAVAVDIVGADLHRAGD